MTNMTFSLWFYPTDDAPSGAGHTFINTNPHTSIGIGYNYGSTKKIYVYKDSDPGQGGWDILSQELSNFLLTLNTWCHLTFVKSGLNYYYYINGSLDKTLTTSIQPVDYNCSIRIGATVYDAEYFQGKMDELRFYNRALTSDQIAYLATQ